MTDKPHKTLGRRILFSFLPLIIGWVVMEGLVLAYYLLAPTAPSKERHMLYSPHAYRNYQLTPNVVDLEDHSSHNAHGLRGRFLPLYKTTGTIRIACLGGSTTYNTSATTDSRTYPARLETVLREHYSSAPFVIEVINAGHPAYTSLETLVLFETLVLDFSPDVAIFHHGLNDTWEGTQFPNFQGDYTHARHTFGPLEVRAWEYSPLLTFLFRKATSPFNPYAPNRSVDLIRLIHNETDDTKKLSQAQRQERVRRCIDTLERNVLTFLALARGNGVIPVLSTMSSRQAENLYGDALLAWNERLRVIAKRESVAFVDFANELPWDPRAYYDTIHLRDRPEGLGRKAKIFADVLIRERIIEQAVAKRLSAGETQGTGTEQ